MSHYDTLNFYNSRIRGTFNSVTGINNLEFIVNYFNKYSLIGAKGKD